MGKRDGFFNYQQFKREMLGQHAGPLTSAVEEIADDMFQSQVSDEPDSLWDSVDSDDD